MMGGIEMLATSLAHPWLAEFERDPDESFDEIIRGSALIFPYGLADPLTVLPSLFSPLDEEDPLRKLLDQTAGTWLERQRQLPHDERRRHGLKIYVRDVVEALTLVQMLELPETRQRLRENYFEYLQWVAPLGISRANDPRARLWMALAVEQPDARFRSLWYRLCREAGARTLPRQYLDIGLLGLRRLPINDETEALRDILGGIATWACHLPDDGRAKQDFVKEWRLLCWLYTRPGNQRWRELIEPIIEAERYRNNPFTVWWRGELGLPTDGRRRLRPVREPDPKAVTALIQKLKKAQTRVDIDRLESDINVVVDERQRWAEATGDSGYLVRTVGNIGGRVIEVAPDLTERLALIGLEWQPSNPILWHHWGRALVALGRIELAEAVFWEALRRFPDNEPSHVEFARLLIGLDRRDEALALLEQAVRRCPDCETSHVELARLLIRLDRRDEALALLEQAVRRFPVHEASHVELARLLAARGEHGDLTRAVEGLRSFLVSHRGGPISLTVLGLMMVHAGRLTEATSIIQQLDRLGHHRGVAEVNAALARAEAGEPVPVPDYAFSADGASSHAGLAQPAGDAGAEASPVNRVLLQDARVTRADYALSPDWDGLVNAELKQDRRDDLSDLLTQVPDHAYARVVFLDRGDASAEDRRQILADFAGLLEVRLIAAIQQRDVRLLTEPIGDEGSGRAVLSALARISLGQPGADDISAAAKQICAPLSGEDDLAVRHVHRAMHELLEKRGVSAGDVQAVSAALPQGAEPIQDILRQAARMVSPVDVAA